MARLTEVTLERTFHQEDFDQFALLSGDNNSIHVNAELAARSRFGRTVAHGMLLYGVLRGLMSDTFPGARQLSQDLMFPAPTFADEPMLFTLRIREQAQSQITLDMEVRRINDQVITCQGQCVLEEVLRT